MFFSHKNKYILKSKDEVSRNSGIKIFHNPSAGRGAVAILGGACYNMVGYFMHTVDIKNRPFCSLVDACIKPLRVKAFKMTKMCTLQAV
jgi:hypothetical protein